MNGRTPHQQQAVSATGNVLVVAGAGAGKTSTLVERCLARVLDPVDPVSLEAVLVVTFTEAAAAELRLRLRLKLEQRAVEAPADPWVAEQLALLESARISTLHGFCLQLVRDHFHELELDPQLTVLDETQAELLVGQTLDDVLRAHYAGTNPADEAIQQLILVHGRGSDEAIRALVRKLHAYTQTLAEPARWFDEQRARYREVQPSVWLEWLLAGLAGWRAEWLDSLEAIPRENGHANQCRTALNHCPVPATRAGAAELFAAIQAANGNWPRGKKGELEAPLKPLFKETEFLASLMPTPDGAPDPLAEDWDWVRSHVLALLGLAAEFSAAFARAKREQGALDFHDLEQFALRLLCAPRTGAPTAVAQEWRARLRHVFVDEYQDINAAQDAILTALARDGAEANRFLVGDVKQSIYRFRLADPRIFQRYAEAWRVPGAPGQVIPLADNFRSHPAILDFVNAVCGALMRREVGGVEYDDEARLRFGAPDARAAWAATGGPRVELHLRLTDDEEEPNGHSESESADTGAPMADRLATELEARLVALRLRELVAEGFQIETKTGRRPVQWGDIVVLLRAPRAQSESYAKEFKRLGVPLQAARGGFYEMPEIADLLSVLTLLDNPLQDVPVLAVLRSPLVGLTLDELALVRLAQPSGRFWHAVRAAQRTRFAANGVATAHPALSASAWPKLERFVRAFDRWRRLARRGALSRCLETVLDETHYEDWLLAQERGVEQRANVQRLLARTRRFDPLQRQGLFRFLKFVEAQRATEFEAEPAAAAAGAAVRLLSIHKSKGLEFPVVVVARLGARFNLADTHDALLLDEEYGLCPKVKPPDSERTYPSLPYWLAARRQKRESLGEEVRLLYVALTRAAEKLILVGSTTRKRATDRWVAPRTRLTPAQISAATHCLDWLGPLVPQLTGRADWLESRDGQGTLTAWRLWNAAALEDGAAANGNVAPTETPIDTRALDQLAARVTWRYPHAAATRETAKSSVSVLRRRLRDEADDEAGRLFRPARRKHPAAKTAQDASSLSAAEIGTAHHTFLQHVALEQTHDSAGLQRELARIRGAGLLSVAEAAALDLAALAAFWQTGLGRRIRECSAQVRRELPFTARFAAGELAALGLPVTAGLAPEEFVVLQGVVDLAVLGRAEVLLVDFKTDALTDGELPEKVREYAPQLSLYALALERIFQRPVTERWLHFLAVGRSERLG